ncbi:MAG: geranylgeranylglycerol-phosphate geranylgeranyltransferase [Candidatus Cloacimonadales bacterium]
MFSSVCVLFGAYYLQPIQSSAAIFWAAVSAFLIAAAGYVINDFFDIEIDIINRPQRILPQKKISPQVAYLFAVLLFLAGLFAAVLTREKYCIIIAFANTLLLFYYAKYFKRMLLLGNLVVAYLAGSTFIFGAIAGKNLAWGLIPAAFAALYTLIRELVKDAEDLEGDKILGAKTIPSLWGRKAAVYAAVVPFASMIWLANYFNLHWPERFPFHVLLGLTLLVHIPLLIFLLILRLHPQKKNFSRVSKFIKLDMLILLLVLLLAIF